MGVDGDDKYDTCVIKSQSEVKRIQASKLMMTACKKLYKDNNAFLSDRDKKYNSCLIQNLQKVENSEAIKQIVSACERQSHL